MVNMHKNILYFNNVIQSKGYKFFSVYVRADYRTSNRAGIR